MPPLPRSQTADEVAQQRAAAALAPYLAALEAERQAADRRAAQRAQSISGYSQAAAEMLKGTGPAVQQGYAQAGDRTAALSSAFSAGFRDEMTKNASGANELLAKHGSPQQVTSQGAAGADVLYGLNGFIPASTLQREGAAFGAAASMLPSTQLGYGMQALSAAQREAEEEQRGLSAKRLEIEAQRPGILQQALAEIRKNNLERQAMGAQAKQSERDYRLKSRAQNLNEQLAVANLGLKQTDLNLKTRKQTFDEKATAARIRNEQTRIKNEQARIRLDLDKHLDNLGIKDANVRIRAGELELKRRKQGKKGGFTSKQMRDIQMDAGTFAREAFQGWVDDDGVTHPPVSYQQAILDMINEGGIPLAIAQRNLNRYWKRPGQTMPWEQPGQGRPYVKFQTRRRKKPKQRGGK